MTNQQGAPEALRLADEAWNFDCSEYRGVRSANAAMMGKLQDCADMIRKLHTENTMLQAGYAAARLEIESLQARIKTMAEEHADELTVAHLDGRMRAAQPAGEYPALPDAAGVVVEHVPVGGGWVRHYQGASYTADQMRAYADAAHAMRASHGQAPAQAAPPHFGDEAHVAIPQMLLCAACSAIDKKRDGTKVLAELRRYTTGDLAQAIAPAPAAMAAPQPAPQQEALRLAKYVARRKLAKQLDANEIHSLDSGCDTEAVLLLSDIEAVLAQVAALTATQPAAPQQDADEIRSYAAARSWIASASHAPADSVLEGAARLTYEQAHAIRQGHEISASDGYFEARPQIDSNDRRKVFQAGFERGWDAARKQGETNEH